MKRYLVLFLLLLPLSVVFASEGPSSIVGVWQFDSARTMLEHIDSMPVPENLDPTTYAQKIATLKEGLASQAILSDAQVKLTITPETMTIDNISSGTNTLFYEIVGGNSRLVVLELSNGSGFEGMAKIRLVTTGIAMERTDCDTYPRQCERERKLAQENMNKQPKYTATTAEISIETPRSRTATPKLIYFRPVAED